MPALQPVRRRARWHSPRDPAKLAVHGKVRLHFQTVQEGRVLPKIARETLAEKQKEEKQTPGRVMTEMRRDGGIDKHSVEKEFVLPL